LLFLMLFNVDVVAVGDGGGEVVVVVDDDDDVFVLNVDVFVAILTYFL
jgi:hypothetical protein